LIYTALSDNEQTFQWLETAFKDRSDMLVYLRVEPRLDPLRNHPRFDKLLRKMNFPE